MWNEKNQRDEDTVIIDLLIAEVKGRREEEWDRRKEGRKDGRRLCGRTVCRPAPYERMEGEGMG